MILWNIPRWTVFIVRTIAGFLLFTIFSVVVVSQHLCIFSSHRVLIQIGLEIFNFTTNIPMPGLEANSNGLINTISVWSSPSKILQYFLQVLYLSILLWHLPLRYWDTEETHVLLTACLLPFYRCIKVFTCFSQGLWKKVQCDAGQGHGAFCIHKIKCSRKYELLVFRRKHELLLFITLESLGRLSIWHICCKRTADH